MRKNTVLIVDDEESVLKSLKRALYTEDYNTIIATSAEMALELLKTTPVDVVISDQMMPGIKGTEFLKIVKDSYPSITRILFSGYSDFESIIQAINDAEVFRFIAKPWNNEELKSLLASTLEKSKSGSVIPSILASFTEIFKSFEGIEYKISEEEGHIVIVMTACDGKLSREEADNFTNCIRSRLQERFKEVEVFQPTFVIKTNSISIVINAGCGIYINLDICLR